MNYLVNWYLSANNHREYPAAISMPLSSLDDLVTELKTRSQVIYVNNVVPDGRLLIWGKDKNSISLELQYSTHWYDRDIAKQDFDDYMDHIGEIVAEPEEHGFNFGE